MVFISDKKYQIEINRQKEIADFNEEEDKRRSRTDKSDQRFCAFCGGSPMLKEHLFSDWIKHLIPRENSTSWTSDNHSLRFSARKKVTINTERVTKQGNLGTIKFRVVCERCNNGWMSLLDDDSSPILTPLILGRPSVLTINNQFRITQWAVLKSIIQDLAKPERQVLTPYEYHFFYTKKKVPLGWRVWIGKYVGKDHFLRNLHGGAHFSGNPIKGNKNNTLHSFFIIGSLLIFTERVEEEKAMVVLPKYLDNKLIQIYPFTIKLLDWSSIDEIDDTDKNLVNNLLMIVSRKYNFKV